MERRQDKRRSQDTEHDECFGIPEVLSPIGEQRVVANVENESNPQPQTGEDTHQNSPINGRLSLPAAMRDS